MPRIRLLPPDLADKIAAGEVIERPASVVKELIENCLDARADRVQTIVSGGGLRSIQVRDNGQGMTEEDAQLALKRHATSKIQDESDLFRVKSFGFRGEALPAIASVAKLTLTTRTQTAQAATRIEVEGGRMIEVGQAGGPKGTSIEIRELFYNTPARLKFLKTHRTETAWIKEAVIRLALPHPGVHFTLMEEDLERLALPPGGLDDRLAQIFGPETAAEMIAVEESHPAVNVTGWVSRPDASRANSRSVYTFVNGRYVRNQIVLAALMNGFQGRLERGRYPVAVLFLDLEPGLVDVNVHPAKLEVRFHHSQATHQAVRRAVSRALGAQERGLPTWSRPPAEPPAMRLAESQERFSGFGPPSQPQADPWLDADSRRPDPAARTAPVFGTEDEDYQPAELETTAPDLMPDFRYLGTYDAVYLVGQAGRELVLIDQHAAHERIIYERLLAAPGQSQPLLMPESVSLSPLAAERLERHLSEAQSYGLEMEPFGPDGQTFVVKALPAPLAGSDPAVLVREIADHLAAERSGTPQESLAGVIARLACHQAVRAGKELSVEEIDALLASLASLEGPLTCPHGRPIIRRFTRAEIDRRFRR